MLLLPWPAVIVPLLTLQLYAGSGATIVVLKLTKSPLHQLAGLDVMLPGTLGLPKMLMVLGTLVPGVQADVLATTVNCPVVNDEDTLSRIVVPPWPL